VRGLTGRNVLAFGGIGTIGTPTTRRLVDEGANVVIADLDAAKAARVAAELTAAGGNVVSVAVDVTDETSVIDAVAAAQRTFGTIDAVHINVADLSPEVLAADTDARSIDLALFDRVVAVNLRGHLACTKHVLGPLLERGGGPIVFTSSAGAYMAAPTRVAYAMSKSGLHALVRHVAAAYGKHGVRANAVAPGLVLDESNGRVRDRAAVDALLAATMSHRLGEPADIAAMVAFLLSDDAEWINGQIVSVDGGLTRRP
jgi:NAD(P)-dependent dehydrogenase (short-subunit alcohol dehydrogenase family)